MYKEGFCLFCFFVFWYFLFKKCVLCFFFGIEVDIFFLGFINVFVNNCLKWCIIFFLFVYWRCFFWYVIIKIFLLWCIWCFVLFISFFFCFVVRYCELCILKNNFVLVFFLFIFCLLCFLFLEKWKWILCCKICFMICLLFIYLFKY